MHSPSILDDINSWALVSSPDLSAFQYPLASPDMQPGAPSTAEGATPQANVEASYALEGATAGSADGGAREDNTVAFMDFDCLDFFCSSPKNLPDQTLDLPLEERPSLPMDAMPASESPQASYSPALSDGVESTMLAFQDTPWPHTTDTPPPRHYSHLTPVTWTATKATEYQPQDVLAAFPAASTSGQVSVGGNWAPPQPTTAMTDEDFALAEATLKAEATGSDTPKIKEELAYRIQRRRREQGMGPVDVKPDPERPEELTAADQERRRRRQASNRKAATKLRNRKKQEEQDLIKNHEQAEQVNATLRAEIRRLSTERDEFEEALRSHGNDSTCRIRKRPSDD